MFARDRSWDLSLESQHIRKRPPPGSQNPALYLVAWNPSPRTEFSVTTSYCRKPRIWREDDVIPNVPNELPVFRDMSHCSHCRCDLPGLETLCSKCYEARCSKLDQRKPWLRSVLRYLSNPLGITRETKSQMTALAAVLCIWVGVFACWFGGFAKLGYKHAFFSAAVFSDAALILLQSASMSLGVSLFLVRKNLSLYWEAALGVFAGISVFYADWAWHVGVFWPEVRSGR